MKFYTSDLHFGHKNILEYENRPFKDVDEMNRVLVENWNRKVRKNDEVYILGDFGFVKGEEANRLLDQLNGRKYLIRGNHDSYFLNHSKFDSTKFEWVKDYATVKDHGIRIVMFHYPLAVWDGMQHDDLHFYGHIHSNANTDHPLYYDLGPNAFNVGCDVRNYEPVTLEELFSVFK